MAKYTGFTAKEPSFKPEFGSIQPKTGVQFLDEAFGTHKFPLGGKPEQIMMTIPASRFAQS